jgi:molybdenum cofactor cytidylyltransferase
VRPLLVGPMTGFHAILLAAGAGRRFGGRKLLAPWRGEPLVLASARIALSAPVDHCVAVVGCDADDVAATLRSLGSSRLEIVQAEDWNDGLSASLRRGVAALPASSLGAVIFLGDMPMVPADLSASLLNALRQGALGAEPRFTENGPIPVAVSHHLYPSLAALWGERAPGPC